MHGFGLPLGLPIFFFFFLMSSVDLGRGGGEIGTHLQGALRALFL